MKIIPQNGHIAGEMLGVYEAPRETVIIKPGVKEQSDTEALVSIRVTAVSENGEFRGNGFYEAIPLDPGAIVVTQAMFLKQFKDTDIVLLQWSSVMAILDEEETLTGDQ